MRFLPQGLRHLRIAAVLSAAFATGHGQEVTGAAILAAEDLPAYERDLRHADLIRGWNRETLIAGREIYAQTCANCHGSLETDGSMPNALRFAEGAFQQGGDPHAIWATNQVQEPGGFYRLRVQDRTLRVVHAVNVHRAGVDLRFTEALPAGIVPHPGQFTVSKWNLERSERYGSKRHDEASLAVATVQLGADRRTVRLSLPSIAPVDQLEIVYRLGGDGAEGVSGRLLATVHALAETPALELP